MNTFCDNHGKYDQYIATIAYSGSNVPCITLVTFPGFVDLPIILCQFAEILYDWSVLWLIPIWASFATLDLPLTMTTIEMQEFTAQQLLCSMGFLHLLCYDDKSDVQVLTVTSRGTKLQCACPQQIWLSVQLFKKSCTESQTCWRHATSLHVTNTCGKSLHKTWLLVQRPYSD